jgi:hypothetical protein
MQPNDYDKEVIPAPDSAVVLDVSDYRGKKKENLKQFRQIYPHPILPFFLERQDDQTLTTTKRIKLQDANSPSEKDAEWISGLKLYPEPTWLVTFGCYK